MSATTTLKSTPLFEDHNARGAKMAPFAGWNMPIQYEGIIAETLWTRTAAACFDICHMGEFLIRGECKKSGLDLLVMSRLDNLKIGRCRYTSLLNSNGGVIDDLIVYRKGEEEWFAVVNAATIEKDKKHIMTHLTKNAELIDLSQKLGKIDLQGPLSKTILARLAPGIENLEHYTFMEANFLGEKIIISRTGYTGELGFEIYPARTKTLETWKELLKDERVKPAGLGSRDVLRLEMGYSLYGQDINEETTPLEAGLDQFIDFNKDFIGKDALLKQKKTGLQRRRCFLKTTSRRAARHHQTIFARNNKIGTITSGSFSPHLGCGIGIGFQTTARELREKIFVGDENLKIEAIVCDRPFVKNTSLKN